MNPDRKLHLWYNSVYFTLCCLCIHLLQTKKYALRYIPFLISKDTLNTIERTEEIRDVWWGVIKNRCLILSNKTEKVLNYDLSWAGIIYSISIFSRFIYLCHKLIFYNAVLQIKASANMVSVMIDIRHWH